LHRWSTDHSPRDWGIMLVWNVGQHNIPDDKSSQLSLYWQSIFTGFESFLEWTTVICVDICRRAETLCFVVEVGTEFQMLLNFACRRFLISSFWLKVFEKRKILGEYLDIFFKLNAPALARSFLQTHHSSNSLRKPGGENTRKTC
jgi:hypothetical protein